jgi:uncharacterized membrane protein YsdA (DUF1294 family)
MRSRAADPAKRTRNPAMIGHQDGVMDMQTLTPETLGFIGFAIVAVLAALNLVTFSVFAMDRSREVEGREPLPEVLLLTLAATGGWPGAKLAQAILRFQGQTAQFRSLLNLVALPLVATAALVTYQTVDLSAAGSRMMSYVGEVTGTGPEVAAARDAQAGSAKSKP